ncbi:MAG TPA: YihY/virulence factor BrkB family protein [Allosphingosinicella sp.]|jgi:membrane protein|uniref:YihY/virulence factor BrkB family protein n=1 Tax=Allosphingosinicella sp. TaxID=2823234 RepID=UPI002F2A8130
MAEAVADTKAAASPAKIPPAGWFQILKRTYAESNKDNVSIVAAGVAFYAFLAFVPLLGALVLTYGLVADPASVMSHVQGLTAVMPADAAKLIGEQLISISKTATSKQGFGLLLALLLSLYGAMRGATSIITALNIVYGVEEDRGFVKTTMLAALITVGAVAALLLGMLAISVMGFIERLLPFSSPLVHTLLQILLWVLAAAGVSAVIALVYRYAPNRPKAKWAWLTPGSITATLLWIAATLGFGFYVTNFGSYNATYGSLGAVVVFLTWLYLTAYILLMGGELNSEIEKVADPQGHPNPAS